MTAEAPQPLLTRPLLTVLVMQIAFGCSISTFLLVPKYLAVDLHATPSEIGVVNALRAFAAVFATPFLSGWLDRRGRKPMIVLGCVGAVAHACAWLMVRDIGLLAYALQIVFGLAAALVFTAAATLATELVPPQRIGQVIGVFGAANISMNAIAPAVAELLSARFGWNAAFVFSALSGVLALVLARRIHEPQPRPSRAHAEDISWLKLARADALELARMASRQRAITFVMVTCGATFGAIFVYYQPMVLAQGAQNVSAFFVGFTVATVSIRLLFGSLADRFGRAKVALYAYVIYAGMAGAMASLTPERMALYGMLFGCVHGVFYPALNALAVERSEPHERSRVMTLVTGAFNFGTMLSVFGLGWVAEHQGYPAMFALAGGVSFLGALALYVARAPAGKAQGV